MPIRVMNPNQPTPMPMSQADGFAEESDAAGAASMPQEPMPEGEPYPEEQADLPDNVYKTAELLIQAIELHQKHMDGSAEVTPESQAELMSFLQGALEALAGSDVPEEPVPEEAPPVPPVPPVEPDVPEVPMEPVESLE